MIFILRVTGIPIFQLEYFASLNIEKVIPLFEDAGIDDVVAECKRQYEAFLGDKDWEYEA